MDDLRKHIAGKLRGARLKKGLTQEAVAEAAGVTTETVSNSERAQSLVSLDVFLRLARVLELDIREFLAPPPQSRKLSGKRLGLEADLSGVINDMSDANLTLLIEIGRLFNRRLAGKS
jgi:transcriptional regulator with XRE-family HTH domain